VPGLLVGLLVGLLDDVRVVDPGSELACWSPVQAASVSDRTPAATPYRLIRSR
jgi:hypothetical protein